MEALDLKGKSVSELQDLRSQLLKEQFNMRIQKASGQASKPHLIKAARRNLARIETALTQQNGSAT